MCRQEVDTYIESLNPEFDYPVFEFEISEMRRGRTEPRRGPGSRMLFLKRALQYFRDDRDSWKRKALYSERILERSERQLLSDIDRLLPDKETVLIKQGSVGRDATHSTPKRPMTQEEYLEDVRKTLGSETIRIPIRLQPGEMEELSADEFARRVFEFWDLPDVRGSLVFGGWRTREEIANAANQELLKTKGVSQKAIPAIRKQVPKARYSRKLR